jgi:hypothetical protein
MVIRTIKHHAFDRVEITDEPITGNVGPAAVGQLMRIADIERVRSDRSLPKIVKFPIPMVEVSGFYGVRVDRATSIFDNSQSKKEGIVVRYTGVAGYAPLCSFLEGGIAVGLSCVPVIIMRCMKDMKNTSDKYGKM